MSLEGQFIGRYRLLHIIGSGNMGEVYLAEDTQLNRKVAIKMARTDSSIYQNPNSIQEATRLFIREARTIASLDHRYILPLYDYGEVNLTGITFTYMVMPFRSEGSFADWMKQRNDSGLLPLQAVNHFVQQAAEALQYAHDRHIAHQDVKPSNFLIRGSGDAAAPPDLLLADFGIAKLLMATIHDSNTVRGTPAYMAPEQWSGHPGPASDQYALAVMTYELLTGQTPFRGNLQQVMYQHFQVTPQPPSQLSAALSLSVDDVLLRALSKQPESRFPTIAAFAAALDHALHEEYLRYAPTEVRSSPAFSSSPTLSTPLPPTVISSNAAIAKRSKMSSVQILLLLIAIVAIAAGSVAVYFAFFGKKNSIPTPGVGNQGTTTVTSVATAGATNPYPPHQGTLHLNDPLVDNTRGYDWNDLTTATYACKFAGGAYHVIQTQFHFFTDCFVEHGGIHFSNFTLQAQMKIIQGDCGGIVFRSNSTENQFYFFRVCQNGFYDLRRFVDNTNSTAQTLTSGFSALILKGLNTTNLLAVLAQGSTLNLYVNQQFVQGITDGAFNDGKIGVAASQNGSPTEVAFNNVMIWA